MRSKSISTKIKTCIGCGGYFLEKGKDTEKKRKQLYGLTQSQLDYLRPFFIGDKAGPQRNNYVLWVDIMGSQGKMLRGVRSASIPLMKMHVAALDAQKQNTHAKIHLYPVIDGIYAVCEDLGPLLFFISYLFRAMAAEFIVLEQWERSVIRGALAYGPVILGNESSEGAEILKESKYANSILLGMPLVQAYVSERSAPPFGVFIHESVRAFGQLHGQPLTTVLWKWWNLNEEAYTLARALLPSLNEYYSWCLDHPISSDYAPDRVNAHHAIAKEYLSEFCSELSADMSTRGPSEEAIAAIRARKEDRRKLKVSPAKVPRATDPIGQAENFRRQLALSESVYISLKPILIEYYDRLRDVKGSKISPEEVRAQYRQINKDFEKALEPFLDETQRANFKLKRH